MTRFKTVILDVDSTLCGVEGIDWLAAQRDASIAAKVESFTQRAMEGVVELETVYGKRLELVAPTRGGIEALSDEYVRALAPGAVEAIAEMRRRGIEVHLISGGLLPAIRKAASKAGVGEENIHAVGIYFDEKGHYSTFDRESPLTRKNGKREIVESLPVARPSLMVGDGTTDLEVRPAVDAFAAFTGFAKRERILEQADYAVSNFDELLALVLG